MGVVELESVEIELDGTPGVGREQIGKVVGELLPREVIDVVLEVAADAADGAGIGLDSLGLHSLELEMLQMLVVIALEFSFD